MYGLWHGHLLGTLLVCLWVDYTVVEDACQNLLEAFRELRQIAEGEFGFVQLTLGKNAVDDLVYVGP